jgi:hypothetical protein
MYELVSLYLPDIGFLTELPNGVIDLVLMLLRCVNLTKLIASGISLPAHTYILLREQDIRLGFQSMDLGRRGQRRETAELSPLDIWRGQNQTIRLWQPVIVSMFTEIRSLYVIDIPHQLEPAVERKYLACSYQDE